MEQLLTDNGQGGAKEAFTTTETMPGAVGGAPLVSPKVRSSTEVNDRGFALRHRVGAWIAHMGRGAGHNFVDYQFRPNAILVSFPDQAGNLRALTEVMPGDRTVSQTDEERFAFIDSPMGSGPGTSWRKIVAHYRKSRTSAAIL